ncbi:MAG TPA: alpha/beta fold hydrolase [Acidimicrobiia bacterium]|nr:alpha/beta fold hydrolase [Acidimicrobiia bacterium]HKN90486.1 alpha/beta fold hydrolase [Acidimicrobiia bacterium]HMC80328.1 alpha/beta fold hydrolase [Acidimicrobiia bacterium]HTC80711.1 alpha/beta fold hydrolase [Acidimicrobiia bacterium]
MATAQAGDGTVIYYEAWGRGEPLLLISGLATDLRIWACQRLVFGRRFRCIALDNRGSGRSAKPDGPYTLEQMAADAVAVLDAEGVGRAHVVGHSMGSYIAQVLAVQHPDRIRSLTLAGTACRHQPWRLELLGRWQETARNHGVHAWARRAFPWLFGPRTAWTLGLFINLLWPIILQQPAHAFDSQIEALLGAPKDARSRLAEVAVPALVVVGSKDTLTTPADAAEVASIIPGARLVTLKGAGHGLMLEAAPDFNEAVLEFLAGVERQPTAATG